MTIGFYGKIPAAADFVHRQLPASFVEAWNSWLVGGIKLAMETFGGDWSKVFLSCPVWSFSADPGVIDDRGWIGVLATSVDSIGRHYPLTFAMSLGKDIGAYEAAYRLQPLAHALQGLSLALIDGTITAEEAVEQMTAVSESVPELSARPSGYFQWKDRYGDPLGSLVVGAAFAAISDLRTSFRPGPAARPSSVKTTFWWHDGWHSRPPEAIRFRGLPKPDAFLGFFDGAWSEHGWIE